LGKVNHKLVKLGKLPYRYDRRNLQLVKYLPPVGPVPPDTCAWFNKVRQPGAHGEFIMLAI
jgi:hypothetical protein